MALSMDPVVEHISQQPAGYAPATSGATLFTSYSLNSKKVVDNLMSDASRSRDMEVIVNNSGSNVNIQCSAGFYGAVAKPSFASISPGHTIAFQNTVLEVLQESRETRDATGTPVNNHVKFSIKTSGSPPTNIGALSFHLHHTTRLIQIQSSCQWPGSKPAPVWFTESILVPLLKKRGEVAKYTIKDLNESILALHRYGKTSSPLKTNRQSSSKCWFCKKPFTTRTNPIPCTTCGKFFHKTTGCWKSHDCCSSSAPVSVHLNKPSRSTSKKRSAADISVTFENEVGDYVPAVPQPQGSENVPVVSQPQPNSFPPVPIESLSAGSAVITNLELVSKPPAKRQKKNAVQTTPEAIENELLKREINVAATRTTSLDNTVQDYKTKVYILEERLKFFESRQTSETYHTYFPGDKPTASSCIVSASTLTTTTINLVKVSLSSVSISAPSMTSVTTSYTRPVPSLVSMAYD